MNAALPRAGATAAISSGVAAGYLAERALLRPRLDIARTGPGLGEIDGETAVLRGPDRTRLFVETYGPDDADEIVLVHGIAMSGRCWHEQIVSLRDRFRLVTYDQPGHARSSPPSSGRYDLDLLADALAAVIENATGGARPGRHGQGGRDDGQRAVGTPERRLVLAGHSMGGMTILALARRHPDLFARRVRATLLASTTAHSGPEDLALGLGIQALVRIQRGVEAVAGVLGERVRHIARVYRASSDLSHLLTKHVGLVAAADPRHVDLTEQLVLDTDPSTVMRLSPALLAMNEDDTLAGLDVPTVIVVGENDTITPPGHARRMARVNPDVDLVELPGIGHMTPLEAHEVVTGLLTHLAATHRP